MSKDKKDPKALIAQIEAEEAAAYVEFEKKQKETREKKLAAILDPLKKERVEVQKAWNDASIRLTEIDKEIAAITGTKIKAKTSGKRQRLTEDAKVEIANKVYSVMSKSTKNRFRPEDLMPQADGVPIRLLVEAWNAQKPNGEKIHKEGKGRATRYFVP